MDLNENIYCLLLPTLNISDYFVFCRCKSLNLHRNHLKSLAQLPKIPAIEHLCVSENNIRSLAELKLLEHTPLHTLTLRHNPCEFLEDYRSR